MRGGGTVCNAIVVPAKKHADHPRLPRRPVSVNTENGRAVRRKIGSAAVNTTPRTGRHVSHGHANGVRQTLKLRTLL